MSAERIGVLLADDHVMVREALARLLVENPRLDVVGQAGDGAESLKLARALKPDVVVLDYSMPGMDAPSVIRGLREATPDAKVLILTIHDNAHYAIKSLESGAHGYVMKSAAVRELTDAILAVRSGGMFVSPSISETVLAHLWHPRKTRVGLDALTQREFSMLRSLGAGKSLKESARSLGIAATTAATYRSRLMEKLKLETTSELIRFAIENDIVG